MSIFSVVIAFFKDIPDVKGDKSSSIQTLSVRLGVRFLPTALSGAAHDSACRATRSAPLAAARECAVRIAL